MTVLMLVAFVMLLPIALKLMSPPDERRAWLKALKELMKRVADTGRTP